MWRAFCDIAGVDFKMNFSMKTISRLLLVAAMALAGVTVSAQTKDFRTPGYKGNVSLIDQLGVWAGLETSHGMMLDRHNYLGAGASFSVCLPMIEDGAPTFGNFFLDYQNYLLDRKSTPVLGLKAGYMSSLNEKNSSGWHFTKAVFVEPNVGWNWGMKNNGCGFTTSLGAAVYKPVGTSSKNLVVMPKLSLTFEF